MATTPASGDRAATVPASAERNGPHSTASTGERMWRRVLSAAADNIGPVLDLYKPYVEGLENLPADGRFLLVGNHTQLVAAEMILLPYFVRQAIGRQLRPLADRRFGQGGRMKADLVAAYGAVVGSPESAAALMQQNEPILVFPGGGREIAKFKGERNMLRWDNRYGFARVAVEHRYPIVTAALIGGDDVYTSLTSRDGLFGQASEWISQRLTGQTGMAVPLVRGIGPTLLPNPQRMYLRFRPPITTIKPSEIAEDTWVRQLKERTENQLQSDLDDLQRLRAADPYRWLNPLAWTSALTPES
ncbi:MAG TPA: lysophospholipid acyltransferase family protein [Mycobacterium sp.]|nr:MAG: acyltransferase family protein [Mycobacterium sp.]HOB50398.1 lysophospholipid acyltransferase family protein [Mycobacterium sp.]HQE15342.1 lysophospholipid acyltransferase family protein [Mycobacterium sp.]